MSNRIPLLTAQILMLTATASGAVMAENISGFSFATYIDGPAITATDLAGRVVGIFAPCGT